jgi:hypothetical protein
MHEEIAASETNAEVRVLRAVGVTSAIFMGIGGGGGRTSERA